MAQLGENMPETNAGASAAEIKTQLMAEQAQSKAEVGEKNETPLAPSEAELTEGEHKEESQTTSEQKLYAGKFKSPEELEKAYITSEKKMYEATREASDTKKIVAELYGVSKKETPEVPNVDDISEEEAQAFIQGMVDKSVDGKLQGVIEPYIADLEVERMKSKHPDFPQLVPHIKKIYDDFPELKKPGNLERAIRLAKSEQMPAIIEEAKREGEQLAVAKKEKEAATQTERPGTSNREDKMALSREAIQRMSAKEFRELLPKSEI